MDIVIKGGKILFNIHLIEAGIAIDDGKIVAISKKSNLPKSDQTINCQNKLILPGLIDTHCHFRDPGGQGEDFKSGTKAAVNGGITTVFDMPNTQPYVSDTETFKIKKQIAEKKVYTDFALYGGIDPTKLNEISSLAKAGVIGYKIFTGIYPPSSHYSTVEHAGDIYESLTEIGKTGLPACIHCETGELLEYFSKKLIKENRRDPLAHVESRPNIVEADSISRMIMFAENIGTRLYIVHLSTKEGLNLIKSARKKNHNIFAETCPHYLLLDSSYMKKFGAYAKVNPPLRSQEDTTALWEGIVDESIQVISSDHAPHEKQDKEKSLLQKDIWLAKSGFVGVETLLPLLLTEVKKGRIALPKLIKTVTENPAKIFSIYPKKGSLFNGSDADLTIVDMHARNTIDQNKLHSKTKSSPFHGRTITGIPVMTIVRGNVIMDSGEIIGKSGYGKFVKPTV